MKNKVLLLILALAYYQIKSQDVIEVGAYNQNLAYNEEGWELIHQGKFLEASTVFENAIILNRDNADSYVGAATAYLQLKQYDLARKKADTAISMTKNQADIYYLVGNIDFNSEDYNGAILNYTLAINNSQQSEVKIDLSNCHYNRGNAYLAIKAYSKAISDYNITLNEKVEFANAYHNRGVALKNLSKKENACQDFHAAIHFGSEMSEKYLKGYCSTIVFTPIDYAKLKALD